ncbi:hypothetical protein LCGC14_2599500, partial [marine sediment metagenome]
NMLAYRFTAWPTDTGQTPDLITVAEDALYHQVMMEMGPVVKDAELAQFHQPLLQPAVEAAISVEAELMIGGRIEQIDAD